MCLKKIYKIIKNFVFNKKCQYCNCNIYTDDQYCSYQCVINDNKDHLK